MRIVRAQPPIYEEIAAVFPIAGRTVFFAFGDRIYNPAGVTIPPEIIAHEAVHGHRQRAFDPADLEKGVTEWWRRYLADSEFRLAEELPAHQAEFQALCEQHRPKWTSERAMRRMIAAHVARKISDPLYGRMIKFEDAKKAIMAGQVAIAS